jgi:uncharacterized damage-inducible protein DinB
MFPRELLSDLLRHMEWADARVWAAIPEAAPVDKRLAELLVHLHVVQRAFLTIWTAGDVRSIFRKPEDFPSWSAIRAWARPCYGELSAFIGGVSDMHLSGPVELPWSAQIAERVGRPPGPTTLGETCFQVTSHSTHHRGQVNARLRELSLEPPLVDYIAWLWVERPSPEWKA